MEDKLKTDSNELLLQRAYRWETEQPLAPYLFQPMGGGELRIYTWKKALDEARRMARHLQSLGIPRGSQVAILSKNSAFHILSDLAIWMAGCTSVIIYPTVSAELLRYHLTHSESKLLFVGKLDTWESMKAALPSELPCIAFPLAPKTTLPAWDDIIAQTEPISGSPVRAPEDPALICYTSGSTGHPKGAVHTFAGIAAAAKGVAQSLELTHAERMLSYLPMAHVIERLFVEAMSLHVGYSVYFVESLETFKQDLRRARPTLFVSVPRLWLKFQQAVLEKVPEPRLRKLLRVPIVSRLIKWKILSELGLHHTRLAASGAAPITRELLQWYADLGLEIHEGYGMSENLAYSHAALPGRVRAGYVGEPWPGVQVRLSQEGEVLVKSPAVMKEYFKAPELTRAAFTEDGYLRTGDRGELDELGRLRLTGRIKELFKTSKGEYVVPVPIEDLLNADLWVEQSCVSGAGYPQPFAVVLPTEELRARLPAEPQLRADFAAAMTARLQRTNAQLEPHEHLAFLVVVKDAWTIENGLLTPTLKMKREAVEKTYSPQVAGWYEQKQPLIFE